jgi:ribosomal protein L32
MTFSPPKKASKVQTGQRHGKWLFEKVRKIKNSVVLQYDEAGNATGLAHFASPVTGQYRGRQVLKKTASKKNKVTTVRA